MENRLRPSPTLLVLGALLFTGCGPRSTISKLPSNQIFISYTALYNDDDRSLETSAVFLYKNAGGRTLSLDGPSRIEFDQESLSPKLTSGISEVTRQPFTHTQYLKRREQAASALGASHQFWFVDSKNQALVVDFTLPRMPSLQTGTAQVRLDDSFAVLWTSAGDLIGADLLYVNVNPDDPARATFREDFSENLSRASSGAHSVTAQRLRVWGAGAYKIQLCRQHVETPKNVPRAGGVLATTTCTASVPVTVTN